MIQLAQAGKGALAGDVAHPALGRHVRHEFNDPVVVAGLGPAHGHVRLSMRGRAGHPWLVTPQQPPSQNLAMGAKRNDGQISRQEEGGLARVVAGLQVGRVRWAGQIENDQPAPGRAFGK